MAQAPNRLIAIGPVGDKIAYLNVDREEAIRRYMNAQIAYTASTPDRPDDGQIREFTFHDSFHVYVAGPIPEDANDDGETNR